MKIEHVVFLRLRPLSTSEWTQLKTKFVSLKSSIPGILDLSIGPNISPQRSDGYTYALRVLFDNESSLRVYATHPEHEEFKKMLPFENDIDSSKPKTVCLDWELK